MSRPHSVDDRFINEWESLAQNRTWFTAAGLQPTTRAGGPAAVHSVHNTGPMCTVDMTVPRAEDAPSGSGCSDGALVRVYALRTGRAQFLYSFLSEAEYTPGRFRDVVVTSLRGHDVA
jgi:hypothetical protein